MKMSDYENVDRLPVCESYQTELWLSNQFEQKL